MRISELFPTQQPDHRRVGIQFPDRHHATAAACRLYREFSLDVELVGCTISYDVVQPMALPVMQMLERACGCRGFNEWEGQA